ncbi:hypothetical protein LguiB_018404 [Lonicera macranthoides]
MRCSFSLSLYFSFFILLLFAEIAEIEEVWGMGFGFEFDFDGGDSDPVGNGGFE